MEKEVKVKKRKRNMIPHKEADIISVAETVAETWMKNSYIVLMWITIEAFMESIGMFKKSYTERIAKKGSRAVITMELKNINAEINDSIMYVKNYICDMYTSKEASLFYPQFGLSKINRTYRMPDDHNSRRRAIRQMIGGINKHGMNENKYGRKYWEDIYSRFVSAMERAFETDSVSSEQVIIKTEQKAIVIKTLNSLIHIIRANYPDSWKNELRVWGFRKERY